MQAHARRCVGFFILMTTPFFDYDLPSHLIAQEPAAERDASRLLVVRRDNGSLSHHAFRDLPQLLAPGDLLVLNETRVLAARLLGRRAKTGGKWEGLFLRELPDGHWELLCQTRGHLEAGETITIEPGPLTLHLKRKTADHHWLAQAEPSGPAHVLLQRHGHVPLPLYIRKGKESARDRERYQTVFAGRPGAVAAPTAGLHFTPDLLDRLKAHGVGSAFLTLHVGLGTFQPIQSDNFTQHVMHREWGELSAETADAIHACRRRGGRVIAVGTTCVRVLETVAATGEIHPWSGETQLFIYPPFQFRAVDALITNFHLPRSTLLLLVSAFTGNDFIRRAYEEAITMNYRFFSYGDAMLIL
jgi:S-adenosylmethionine:tRNA ribosyltransferase-isomerase